MWLKEAPHPCNGVDNTTTEEDFIHPRYGSKREIRRKSEHLKVYGLRKGLKGLLVACW